MDQASLRQLSWEPACSRAVLVILFGAYSSDMTDIQSKGINTLFDVIIMFQKPLFASADLEKKAQKSQGCWS